jgi:hypothetical protein
VQLQVFGIPINSGASGDIEILPQGSTFGSTATEVYVGNVAFNTVSTTAKINLANNQIGVQVRGGGADVAIDVVGYFKRPGNYSGTHVITGEDATDSGGSNNTASGGSSTVAGGASNIASGVAAAVIGGFSNTASGNFATVAGGYSNTASGTYSFAAGVGARAVHDRSFVWSDGTLYQSEGAGHFTVHAGAVEFEGLGGTGCCFVVLGKLSGQLISTSSGAYLSDAGVWVNGSSSKTTKTDFSAVDTRDVLEQVARLPITTWRYKQSEGEVRHMGPMAEDFWTAFDIGYGDHTIADLDVRGVALAAIQGLNAKLDERVADQQREIADLRRIVLELRSAMH